MADQKKTQKTDEQKKARKSTKGIPRITDKVLAMDEAGRNKWLAEKCGSLSAETRKEIEQRMAEALKEGRKPKKVDFGSIFKGRSVEELTQAQTALDAAMSEAADTQEENLKAILAKAEAELAAIRRSKEAQKTPATEAAATAPATA